LYEGREEKRIDMRRVHVIHQMKPADASSDSPIPLIYSVIRIVSYV
jgi:hypothetical protein